MSEPAYIPLEVRRSETCEKDESTPWVDLPLLRLSELWGYFRYVHRIKGPGSFLPAPSPVWSRPIEIWRFPLTFRGGHILIHPPLDLAVIVDNVGNSGRSSFLVKRRHRTNGPFYPDTRW